VFFPGKPELARASILDALGRFEQMQETWIPRDSVQRVFDTIRGAALAHGIAVERQAFEKQIVPPPAPLPAPEPDAPTERELRERNRIYKEAEAWSDLRADELLAAMGLE
jgi:hypothetical protein